MEDLSLHILDLAQNSIAAGATLVEIAVCEDLDRDLLSIECRDNGCGMSAELLAAARDPFVSTNRTRKAGLGLPLFAASCAEAGGGLEIDSAPGQGTSVRGSMRRSHIDCRPLGDLAESLIALIIGAPEVEWICVHRIVERGCSRPRLELDTRQVRGLFVGLPLNHPLVIGAIREALHNRTEREHE